MTEFFDQLRKAQAAEAMVRRQPPPQQRSNRPGEGGSTVDSDRARLRWTTAAMQKLRDKLAEQRVQHTSRDGVITAIVDGNGVLLDLSLARGIIRAARPGKLGPAIARTINIAQAKAAELAGSKVDQVLSLADSGVRP